MFNRELPKLSNDAIIAGDATILSIPVNLLHLLTIQESGEFRRRGRQENELRTFTPVTTMPPDYHEYLHSPTSSLPWLLCNTCLLRHQYEGSLALLTRKILPICTATLPGSSSASPCSWTPLRNASSPSTRKDTLSTLERISEARIARHGLPAGLMIRLKDPVKTWRRTASSGYCASILGPRGSTHVSFFGFYSPLVLRIVVERVKSLLQSQTIQNCDNYLEISRNNQSLTILVRVLSAGHKCRLNFGWGHNQEVTQCITTSQ